MGKHTRSPWHLYADKWSRTISVYDYRNSTRHTVVHWTGFEHCDVKTYAKQLANAKLMVAAPDLLKACKEFVRKCECGEARSKRSYAQMKKAIEKAENDDG